VYTQYLWPISPVSLMQCFYRPVTSGCVDMAFGVCIGKVQISIHPHQHLHFPTSKIRTSAFYLWPSTAIIETTSSDDNLSVSKRQDKRVIIRPANWSVWSRLDTHSSTKPRENYTIGTLYYNWPMSAHVTGLQHVQCTDSVITPCNSVA